MRSQTFLVHVCAVLPEHEARINGGTSHEYSVCLSQVHWPPAKGRQPGSCSTVARQNSCSLLLKRCVRTNLIKLTAVHVLRVVTACR